MMTVKTVRQLLQVFRLFRENYLQGTSFPRSYHDAVRQVAKDHSVTYQTIGDGCRRRLRLNDINELFELLDTWIKGGPKQLIMQLKDNAEPAAHQQIEEFFSMRHQASIEKPNMSAVQIQDAGFEALTFRLPKRDARMLRALAELEGTSVPELIGRHLSKTVQNRMKELARGIISGH